MNHKLIETIDNVERAHFRTAHDTGAHPCAMRILNAFRCEAGLPSLAQSDLPEWDAARLGYFMPQESRLLCAREFLNRGGKV